MTVVPLNRTLDQELLALSRGASLECPVCGEFVMRVAGSICCPECRFTVAGETHSGEEAQLRLEAG